MQKQLLALSRRTKSRTQMSCMPSCEHLADMHAHLCEGKCGHLKRLAGSSSVLSIDFRLCPSSKPQGPYSLVLPHTSCMMLRQ